MDDGNISINIDLNPSVPNLKVISINGTMDSISVRQVDETVFPVLEQEKSNIIFDLSNLNYLSSTGILCLLKYIVSFHVQRRLLKFVKPPKNIYNELEVAGISKKFDMYDSLEAAISSFKSLSS